MVFLKIRFVLTDTASGVLILNFHFYGNKKFDIRMLWIIWIYLSYLCLCSQLCWCQMTAKWGST